MAPSIVVRNLSKVYAVPERPPGAVAALKSLFRRTTRRVRAVDAISFDVAPGEIVGFLGPNGAGKTTTLKMLSGLLYPDGGTAAVLGHVPSRREHAFLARISLVMGQRSQLNWDIPVADSFEFFKAIYRVPDAEYRRTLAELDDLLDLGALLTKPARNLSLGQRMKCEFAAALLHRPAMLFLDEPTIGLDVTMQARIRRFLREYNRRTGATVLLTSHYMADVEALCKRVIVIHHGRLLYDGDLQGLVERFSPYKVILVDLQTGTADLRPYGEVVERAEGRVELRVPKADTPHVTARLLRDLPVVDLLVEDPPIDDVIQQVFAQEVLP